jgi:hypothetical protein
MNMQIDTCDGTTAMRITGGGTVRLVVQTRKNRNVEFLLTDVAYAPNSRCSLLSLPKLADAASIKWSGTKQGKSCSTTTATKSRTHHATGSCTISRSTTTLWAPFPLHLPRHRSALQQPPLTGTIEYGTSIAVSAISVSKTCGNFLKSVKAWDLRMPKSRPRCSRSDLRTHRHGR